MSALEIGTTIHSSWFTIHSVLWHHHGTNMIDWIMDTTEGENAEWQSVNHATVNSLGLEASAQLSIINCQLSISYSYIHQDKKQQPDIVSQYALEYLRHKLVGTWQMPLTKRLSLNITGRWQDRVGSYTDFDGKVCDYKPYCLIDARLCWQQDWWKAYVKANNIADTRYHDYGLVEQPGRWIIAGISIGI